MSSYNPDIHQRRSIRLKGYDYSQNGAYFVTMCTFDRGCHFEEHEQLRHIIETQWQNLPERFLGVMLDEFVIMPNHFHGIIILRRDTPRGYPGFGDEERLMRVERETPCVEQGHPRGVPLRQPSIGEIVGSFKSLCVNAWLKIIKEENLNAVGKFWQKNYYDHIIRNANEMERIRRYIVDNPLHWELDRENPLVKKDQPAQSEQWML
ncbi:MAG: transposase [Deltaproteobacteria bacterium]|nr:transposase [Deltaproteobacteria bacterium]